MKKVVIFIAFALLIGSVGKICLYKYESVNNERLIADAKSEIYGTAIREDEAKCDGNEVTVITEESTIEPIISITENYAGWISIPGTVIDYPVVQGQDNTFYLNHDVYNQKNSYGSIFIDANYNEETDLVKIIYGHHMDDGQMFTDLLKYQGEEFRHNHTKFLINESMYQIVAAKVIDLDEQPDFYKVNYLTENGQKAWLKDLGIEQDVSLSDTKLVLLSTCYEYGSKLRMIVLGISI